MKIYSDLSDETVVNNSAPLSLGLIDRTCFTESSPLKLTTPQAVLYRLSFSCSALSLEHFVLRQDGKGS